MRTFHKLTTFGGIRAAVFRISTIDRGNFFMCVSRTNHEHAVVEVDAHRLLSLWRSEPFSIHTGISHGTALSWKQDYKFADAETGFLHGEINPVPLADVSCYVSKKRSPIWRRHLFFFKKIQGYEWQETPYATIGNGITRTIWLMAFGAKVFPVKCSMKEAPLLQQLAGLPGGNFQSVDTLISE